MSSCWFTCINDLFKDHFPVSYSPAPDLHLFPCTYSNIYIRVYVFTSVNYKSDPLLPSEQRVPYHGYLWLAHVAAWSTLYFKHVCGYCAFGIHGTNIYYPNIASLSLSFVFCNINLIWMLFAFYCFFCVNITEFSFQDISRAIYLALGWIDDLSLVSKCTSQKFYNRIFVTKLSVFVFYG